MSQPSNYNESSTLRSISLYPTVGYQWNSNVGIQEQPDQNQPGIWIDSGFRDGWILGYCAVPVPVPDPTKNEELTTLLSDEPEESKISRKEKVISK